MPKEIAEMYTFEKRVPLMPRYFDEDAKWIENPDQPNWNIEDIDRYRFLQRNMTFWYFPL